MKPILPLLGLLVLFGSCSHSYYSPNTQNVPLFEKQGELRVTYTGNRRQKELQSAVSITDHLGFLYNHYSIKTARLIDPWGGSTLIEKDAGKFQEGGIGYFTKLKAPFIFEIYSGYGQGAVETQYEYGFSRFRIKRFFLQPVIGYRNDHVEMAFSCRAARLQYDHGTIGGFFDIDEEDTRNMMYVKDHPVSFLIEPAFTLRGGYEFVTGQIQVAHSYNLTTSRLKQVHAVCTIGLIISLRKEFLTSLWK